MRTIDPRPLLLVAALIIGACASDSEAPASDGGGDTASTPDASGEHDVAPPRPDAAPPPCASVTVEFVGEVAAVSNSPFGLDDTVRAEEVNGAFAYSLCVNDADPDVKRGEYDHRGGGALALAVAGLTIAGSDNPVVKVENLDPDTFRFLDGPQLLDEDVDLRVVEVDGERRPDVKISISFTDPAGAAFSSDALPNTFPFLDLAAEKYPHTFSVQDAGGTLLLQLTSLR